MIRYQVVGQLALNGVLSSFHEASASGDFKAISRVENLGYLDIYDRK